MSTKKILVVDDDQEWNFLLKMKLSSAGYSVEQAFNGDQALKKVAESKPDIILLDITMPVMDGWQVCEELRKNVGTKLIPIVIQSSLAQSEDLKRGQSYSVERFIMKPCSGAVIVQTIRDILASK